MLLCGGERGGKLCCFCSCWCITLLHDKFSAAMICCQLCICLETFTLQPAANVLYYLSVILFFESCNKLLITETACKVCRGHVKANDACSKARLNCLCNRLPQRWPSWLTAVFSCLIMASCTLQLLQTLEGHTDRVWHVSWSPDGATVLELCSRPYDISPVRNQTVLRRCDIGKLQCRQNC